MPAANRASTRATASGLADSEVSQAQAAGFLGARLGPRVLRTETAPVVALSVAQQLWGDF